MTHQRNAHSSYGTRYESGSGGPQLAQHFAPPRPTLCLHTDRLSWDWTRQFSDQTMLQHVLSATPPSQSTPKHARARACTRKPLRTSRSASASHIAHATAGGSTHLCRRPSTLPAAGGQSPRIAMAAPIPVSHCVPPASTRPTTRGAAPRACPRPKPSARPRLSTYSAVLSCARVRTIRAADSVALHERHTKHLAPAPRSHLVAFALSRTASARTPLRMPPHARVPKCRGAARARACWPPL